MNANCNAVVVGGVGAVVLGVLGVHGVHGVHLARRELMPYVSEVAIVQQTCCRSTKAHTRLTLVVAHVVELLPPVAATVFQVRDPVEAVFVQTFRHRVVIHRVSKDEV